MEDSAASKSAVRKDVWVRLPPAAPLEATRWPDCRAQPRDPNSCVDDRGLGRDYVYLLGLYLGDGMLSPYHRGVWRLRIFQDSRYVGLIAACKSAILEVTGRSPGESPKTGCVEIYSSWKHWLCLFPQHGPGPKHDRPIVLEDWQWLLVERYPQELVKGLIHSDGCRTINRIRIRGRTYEYPRYFFTNHSDEIRAIFGTACDLIGVESRPNNRFVISVARRRSVEILETFIGPKR